MFNHVICLTIDRTIIGLFTGATYIFVGLQDQLVYLSVVTDGDF